MTGFFFNPTIDIVTFRLGGWFMQGVFLLPALTRIGHECQDLLSPCDGMHMCAETRPRFILFSERVFGKLSQSPCKLQGKIPYTGKNSPEEDRIHDAASSRTACPTHYQRAIPTPIFYFNVQLSQQICPLRYAPCCWDIKQPTSTNDSPSAGEGVM